MRHVSILKLIVLGVAVLFLNGCSFGPKPVISEVPTCTPYPTATPLPEECLEEGSLLINEVYASTDGTDSWVEIYNTESATIRLDEVALDGVLLKGLSVPANGYVIVKTGNASEADSVSGKAPVPGNDCILSLDSLVLDKITLPEQLLTGISYGRVAGTSDFAYFLTPTAESRNGGMTVTDLSGFLLQNAVKINEYMGKSRFILIDEDGDAVDWVELKNCGNTAINLKNFGLTDNFDKPFKYTLPDITLEPGEMVVICLSGKEKEYNPESGYIHAPFKISESDDGLMVSSSYGFETDRVENLILHDTLSVGRATEDSEKWLLNPRPTPGRENAAGGFDTLEEYENGTVKTIIVSEVCAVSSEKASNVPNDDWIELYNSTNAAINLEGYHLSKDIEKLDYYTFPSVSIPAGGYLVVDAGDTASQETGKLNTGFKVGSSGSTIYLTDKDGYPVDVFETGVQRANVTSGQRIEGNSTVREFYTTPTRGSKNAAAKTGYALPVTIESDSDELTAEKHIVTLSTAQKNGKIYYTLDGSTPNEYSTRYTGPITITESCVVKAVCFVQGLVTSDVATRTFLCDGRTHTLSIVCVSSDPAGLYSDATGIFALGPNASKERPNYGANFWKEWERACTFEYYENGRLAVEFDAGMKVQGQYTRARESKSFSINLKDAYGPKSVYYPFFGENGVKEFSNLLIRSAGQDQSQTLIRDAFYQRALEGQLNLDMQDEKPVALYINGEYQGLYFIREKLNSDYIETYSGIEEDNLDYIKGARIRQNGDCKRMDEIINYIKAHDMSTTEAYDYIAERVDLDEWMNFWIIDTYFGNADSGNLRFYSARDDSSKWRWILYDMDMALESYTWDYDLLGHILNPEGHGHSNDFYTYLTYNMLLVNPKSQAEFIEKYAQYMKTFLQPERLKQIYKEYLDEVESEVKYHCAIKTEIYYEKWKKNTNAMLDTILDRRYELVKEQLQTHFNLSDERMAELFD